MCSSNQEVFSLGQFIIKCVYKGEKYDLDKERLIKMLRIKSSNYGASDARKRRLERYIVLEKEDVLLFFISFQSPAISCRTETLKNYYGESFTNWDGELLIKNKTNYAAFFIQSILDDFKVIGVPKLNVT